MTDRVAVFGASGRVGSRLLARFAAAGRPTLAIGRRPDALAVLPGAHAVLDLAQTSGTETPLRPGDVVINAAHARFTQAIAALCPPDIDRFIVLGSTRYRTRFPDTAAEEVRDAAGYLATSDLPWVLLHPTMIYGAAGENNVQRIAALIRRLGVVPLPAGGCSLIQPVHADDVVAGVEAAVQRDVIGRTIHLGGPAAVSYADFVRAIAAAAGTRARVIALPAGVVHLLAAATRLLPGVPTMTRAEVRRLMEDKAVDVTEMRTLLGVASRPLADGLRQTFAGNS